MSASFRQWIEQRTGLDSILAAALDEPIPGGARWAYIFGSGLLFLFVSQVLSGVILALYYVPASNDAHITVAYIIKVASGGSFLRSLHSYGASALIVVLLLHTVQTFFFGSYKGRRELVWLSGCALFGLMLGMAFTGYLLPWDQKAYFATAVGTSVMGELPGAGNFLKELLRGGNQLGTTTLSRFFVLHVFVLPALILFGIVSHVYLFRKAGPAGPIDEDPVTPRLAVEKFYPRQFGRDFVFAVLLVTIMGALAYFFPVRLGPEANPADTAFLPRPEWYFLPMFQWLKFWPGASALIGVSVMPAIVTFLFVALPFIDRRLERHPLRRPLAIGGFVVVLGGMIACGILSEIQDRRDPIVVAQLARQDRATQAFMNAPFVPLSVNANAGAAPVPTAAPAPATTPAPAVTAAPPASAPAVPTVQAKAPAPAAPPRVPAPRSTTEAPAATAAKAAAGTNPLVAQGRMLYVSTYKCVDCHGDRGEGSQIAPPLAGISTKKSPDDISAFLQNPSEPAQDAGMPTIPSGSPDFPALIAYVLSLQP